MSEQQAQTDVTKEKWKKLIHRYFPEFIQVDSVTAASMNHLSLHFIACQQQTRFLVIEHRYFV